MPRGYANGEALTKSMLTDFERRISSKIEKVDEHWLWTGAATGHAPAPLVSLGGKKNGVGGKVVSGRRAVYAYFVDDVPAGSVVLVECEEPLCVRPEHLKLTVPGEIALRRSGIGWEAVEEIRRDVPRLGYDVVADKLGLTRVQVVHVFKNRTWVDEDYEPNGRPWSSVKALTAEQVDTARTSWLAGTSVSRLARDYGVAQSTMWYAVHRDRPRIRPSKGTRKRAIADDVQMVHPVHGGS